MAYSLGFDLRTRTQHASRLPAETPRIEIGDVVRDGPHGLLLDVINVDGENVYCAGFIDPFNADSLEVVS